MLAGAVRLLPFAVYFEGMEKTFGLVVSSQKLAPEIGFLFQMGACAAFSSDASSERG